MEFGANVNEQLDGIAELILDFENVTYISSIGLRVILELQKRMNEQGKMKVVNVNKTVMDIFKMTGFDKILNFLCQ